MPDPAATPATPAPHPAAALPKVVLIGDSIRMGYAEGVAERLQGKADVVSPAANGGDSANVLKNLATWASAEQPDLIHLNCGLHDLKRDRETERYQVDHAQYEANLREIVARLRQETRAALVFASTTPIHDARHAQRGANFDRFDADVERYNTVALAVMRELGVTVHDLNALVREAGPEEMLRPDGTHYTPEGNARLAEAVADCIARQLSVLRYPSRPAPKGGPEAAEAYRTEAARRDALVPPAYLKLGYGSFTPPASAAAWQAQRPDVLAKVLASLGDLPPRPSPEAARIVSREIRPGYTLERVAIDSGVGNEVSALLLLPEPRRKPAPAVLWLHSSTPDKNQVITPNTNGGAESLGEAFVRAGYVVLAPDAYWHGDRVGTGPSGTAENTRDEQMSLFKLNLWLGRTLCVMCLYPPTLESPRSPGCRRGRQTRRGQIWSRSRTPLSPYPTGCGLRIVPRTDAARQLPGSMPRLPGGGAESPGISRSPTSLFHSEAPDGGPPPSPPEAGAAPPAAAHVGSRPRPWLPPCSADRRSRPATVG